MGTGRQGILRCLTALAGATLLWGAAPALAHEEAGGEGVDDGHVVPHTFQGFPGIRLDGDTTWILQGTDGNGSNDSTDLSYSLDLTLTGTVSETGHVIIALEAGNGHGVDERLHSLSTANYDAFITEATKLTAENNGTTDFNPPNVSQLYYEGDYYGGNVVVDFGKLDVHSLYDDNAYANDETDQFVSAIFVRSAGTTYAQMDQYYAPGLAVSANLAPWVSVLGLAANGTGAGFDAVSDGAYGVGQVDLKPGLMGREGNYRIYGIYDGRKYTRIATGATQSNVAYGVSLDQALPGGLGLFARYSAQDDQLAENAVKSSWSLGAAAQGKAWGRDDDVIGVGYGVVTVNKRAPAILALADPGDEGHVEAYYKVHVSDHFTLTPDVQVITHNGGDAGADTVTVAGVRGQLNF
jgi:high affinity Mn2+ porin